MPVAGFRALSGRRGFTGRRPVTAGIGGGGGTVGPASTTVSTIAALKAAVADNAIGIIVVTNGTYACVNATDEATTSLFFGASLASRTLPVTIRAETIAYDDYVRFNGEQGAKEAGKMRLEGKEYVVRDGDVMHFRFTS